MLGHDHSALYSYPDEMPSSDPELPYVKHYKGEVEELGLTFSFVEDRMGRVVTHELVPGGRGIDVINSNRISSTTWRTSRCTNRSCSSWPPSGRAYGTSSHRTG